MRLLPLQSSDRALPVPPALLRSISRCLSAARGAQDSAILLCCPRHAPPHRPLAPVRTRVRRCADQSPPASDTVQTCTRRAAGHGLATDNPSTVYRPRGCAPWAYSPRPPCTRLVAV